MIEKQKVEDSEVCLSVTCSDVLFCLPENLKSPKICKLQRSDKEKQEIILLRS